ncbi:MAG TPA: type II asparaginase [Geminicoccaceae bacterium]|nr:type II asparaginase [Geminicoccus sp.]HMU52109.1 type II asparaginase [Geminicoccaceae bacterium]
MQGGGAAAAVKPRIHVLATGGTIAGAQASTAQHGYTAGSFSIDALIAAVPQIARIATVTGEQLVNIGSQDMNDAVWLKLAARLRQLAASPEIDGIVVTHGTDTMEETAYFADLTTPGDKPVVFVGSMRPATAISADGPINLYNAVAVAGSAAARGHGALVVLNDEIHAARNVYKTHTTRVDAFVSPDRGPVGAVDTGQVEMFAPPGPRLAPVDLTGRDRLPKVEIVYAHSDMGRDLIDAAVAAGARGIVVAGVGNGNTTEIARAALADAVGRGVAVVRSTRLVAGEVVRNAEVDDDRLGFVVADELKPGKARVLLQLLLLQGSDPATFQRAFNTH